MPAYHQRLVQQGRCGAGSLLRLRHSHRRRPQAGGIGIDGIINFFDEDAKGNKKPQKVLVMVKSGKVNSGQIRDLKGAVEREGAAIGVFIMLENPTQAMNKEALAAGWYESPAWGKKYRRLQILTIGDLFEAWWKRGDVSEDGESQRDLI